MKISLVSEIDNAPISVNLSSHQGSPRNGAILGPHTLTAVGQVLNDAISCGVPVIALTTHDQLGFCLNDSMRLLKLTHNPSKAVAEAFGQEFREAVLDQIHKSRQTLLYCNNVLELLRHEHLARWIETCLATGRSIGLSVLIGSDNPDTLQNGSTDVATQILPFLSFILTSKADGQFHLDDAEGIKPCRITDN
jgi:hypothetical protein